ncbi:hypothetical protein BZA70DRAFT_284000 [Myxozyma melibiosi]|uniref:Uncharacterized protein n=1 Tax=Myxozyma melibiosi TaxID=54550 RepID=A0ABR1F038_9ASCO
MSMKKFKSKGPKGRKRTRQHSPPPIDKKTLRAKLKAGDKADDASDKSTAGSGSGAAGRISKPKPKAKKKRKREEVGGNTPRDFLMLMSRMGKSTTATTATTNNSSEKKPQLTDAEKKELKKQRLEKKKREESERREKDRAKEAHERRKQFKMLPGETFSEFSRRVDDALPVIKAKSGVPSAAAVRRLKKQEIAEKNGQKPVRRKTKKGDPEEVLTDDGEDYSDEEKEEQRYQDLKNKRSSSPDPWLKLRKSNLPKFGEVAEAPPVLKVPSKKLLSVPKKAGSLAERLVLEAEREMVIGKYRAMVERKQWKSKKSEVQEEEEE